GHAAPFTGLHGVRLVEYFEHGGLPRALPIGIDAALPRRRLFLRENPLSDACGLLARSLRNRRKERRTARCRIELSACRENDIANDLALQAAHGEAPQVDILGILFRVCRAIEARRHLIRARRQDQAMDLLDAPAFTNELAREPIEQLRV